METIHTPLETPIKLSREEMMGQASVEVFHQAMVEIGGEMGTVVNFERNGRKFAITNVAGAIVALGQVPHEIVTRMYQQIINPEKYVVGS